MKKYEIMYVLTPSLGEDIPKVVKQFESVIETNDGVLEKTDVWGEKKLAYNINDHGTGVYVLTTFSATPSCIKEVDRLLRLNENVLRHLIIGKSA